MSALRERVQSPDLLQSQRAALVLHHTLKELSTKRLGIDQRNFAQVSPLLPCCPFVCGLEPAICDFVWPRAVNYDCRDQPVTCDCGERLCLASECDCRPRKAPLFFFFLFFFFKPCSSVPCA